MPTSTFFRLPEEKRQRLLDAAWEEFSRTSFSDASINQIIHSAHIPRGSFYQYFEDKSELFWYLLNGMRAYYADVFRDVLKDVNGDLFAFPVHVFDRFISHQGNPDPVLTRFLQVVRRNQGMDFQHVLAREPGMLSEDFMEQVVLTGFRKKDREYVCHVFFLMLAPLAYAIMEMMRGSEQWERQRNILQTRIEIIRQGCLLCEEK